LRQQISFLSIVKKCQIKIFNWRTKKEVWQYTYDKSHNMFDFFLYFFQELYRHLIKPTIVYNEHILFFFLNQKVDYSL
jgi:hypothetical protein